MFYQGVRHISIQRTCEDIPDLGGGVKLVLAFSPTSSCRHSAKQQQACAEGEHAIWFQLRQSLNVQEVSCRSLLVSTRGRTQLIPLWQPGNPYQSAPPSRPLLLRVHGDQPVICAIGKMVNVEGASSLQLRGCGEGARLPPLKM